MRFFFSLLLSLCSFYMFAQGNARDSAWTSGNYYKLARYINMRNGIRLFTAMYIPSHYRKTSYFNEWDALFLRSL